ncbi:MAG: AAA family ATPase [Solirubrobacteraceae bacterium]|nr:AAA family ATPase [Patulibacter sp.]
MPPQIQARASVSTELRTLITSRHAGVLLDTDEETRALSIVDTVGYDLHIPVFDWTVTQGLARRGSDEPPMYQSTKPSAALVAAAGLDLEAIFVMRDLRPSLGDPEVSRNLRDLLDHFDRSPRRSTVIILGSHPELPSELRDRIVTLPLGLPTDEEYGATLNAVSQSLILSRSANVSLSPLDANQVVSALRGLTLEQARQALAQAAVEDGVLDLADVPRLVDLKARTIGSGGLLEYYPPGDNDASLGGFARLRGWLGRAQVGFSAEARALNLPEPKGVLLTGVQGCGKSLAAKAIARAWSMPLLRLDAGRLYDKYIGETEKNLRRSLEIAESLAPAILWIDEIEKALATGGSDSADGGVSQRQLGTLLTWMAESKSGVFLVATSNDAFRLPPELLRKGRFDELFFVDLPTADERTEILTIHLRARRQDPATVDLAQLSAATDGFSGAELEQVVVGTLLGSLQRHAPADTAAYIAEANATVPLSRSRAEDIARLRAMAVGRFVPVA